MYKNYLIALWIILWVCTNAIAQEKPSVFSVEAVKVRQGNIAKPEQFIGTVHAKKQSLLTAKVDGIVASIPARSGKVVEKGDVLINFEHANEEKALTLARKKVENKRLQVKRAEALLKTHDISIQKLEEEKAVLLAYEMELQTALKAYDNTVVQSPFRGQVGVPRASLGAHVHVGDPLITVVDLDELEVTFQVPAKLLPALHVGQSVEVKKSKSVIEALEKTVDPKTMTGLAKTIIRSCEKCIVGGRVTAIVDVDVAKNVLILPRSSVFYRQGKPQVYVIQKKENGHEVVSQEIELGVETKDEVQIKKGLSGQELVVRINPSRLRPQSLVKVQP